MSSNETNVPKPSQKLHELQELYGEMDRKLRDEFKRSLPFQDSMFDRWERAKELGFGAGTSVYNSAFVYGKVIVGENVWIGPNTVLDGMGELTIGNHCAISIGVQIYTHDTILRSLSGGKHPMHLAPVRIGDNCHIAPSVVITAGVTLGNRCLVAINSFVNKSFGDNVILAGTPAVRIGQVIELIDGSIELRYDTKRNKDVNDTRRV